MKKYMRSMRVPLVIIGILLVFYLILWCVGHFTDNTYIRDNDEAPTERVFDYADLLTDSEEQKLRDLIAKREAQIGCDIVIVTLNTPLKAYAENYYSHVPEDKYVMVFADNFYDENKFGYDMPYGDGCVLVDNWNRSDSVWGYAYNWISTSGRVEDRFSNSMIRKIIDDVNEDVNRNPYKAYVSYVNNVYKYMSGHKYLREDIPFFWIFLAALIVSTMYLIGNLSKNKGRRTTMGNTYVNGGLPVIHHQSDVFVTKNVTSRHIQTSSGSGGHGGGGHHMSSGGHSHGGGGGHH